MQVISSEAPQANSDAVVNLIATSLTALKTNVVSMVNRNRRLWRGIVKARTLSDSTSTEMDIASETSTHSLEQGTLGSEEALCVGDGVDEGEHDAGGGSEAGNECATGDRIVDNTGEVCVGGDVSGDVGGGDAGEDREVRDSGREYVMTVSREDFDKLNNAMRMMRELETNLPHALTAWSNLKLEQSQFTDTYTPVV